MVTQKAPTRPPLAYLAGAMEHAPDRGAAWRAELSHFLIRELGHRVFNPCVEELKILEPEERVHLRHWKQADLPRFRQAVRKLIQADLNTLLREVDYVVCLWDRYVLHGGGTHGELTMAHYHGIPVYLVAGLPIEEISSWILGCTSEVFTNFGQLKTFLLQRYL